MRSIHFCVSMCVYLDICLYWRWQAKSDERIRPRRRGRTDEAMNKKRFELRLLLLPWRWWWGYCNRSWIKGIWLSLDSVADVRMSTGVLTGTLLRSLSRTSKQKALKANYLVPVIATIDVSISWVYYFSAYDIANWPVRFDGYFRGVQQAQMGAWNKVQL